MPFFKDLRRKKSSSTSDKSSSDSKSSKKSNGTVPTAQSSSTLNSLYGASTPSSSIQPQSSTPNLLHRRSINGLSSLPPKPIAPSPSNKRNSVLVCCYFPPHPSSITENCVRSQRAGTDNSFLQGMSAPSINGSSTPKIPTSPYAPRILSVSDNSWVWFLKQPHPADC